MSSPKTKRKANPRRRLLIQLGVSGVIALLIASAFLLVVNRFQPQPPQLILMSTQDVSEPNLLLGTLAQSIWFADTDNSDMPQQVAAFEIPPEIRVLSPASSPEIFLISGRRYDGSHWRPCDLLRADSQFSEGELILNHIGTCEDGVGFKISADGNYLVYRQRVTSEADVTTQNIILHEIGDGAVHEIHSLEGNRYGTCDGCYSWIGEQNQLFLRVVTENHNEYVIYDIATDEYIDTPLTTVPEFSDDGQRYAYVENITTDNGTSNRLIIGDTFSWNTRSFEIIPDKADEVRVPVIYDWHPDNSRFLVNELHGLRDESRRSNHFMFYNLDGTSELIFDTPYYQFIGGTFNHDGSQVLLSRHNGIEAYPAYGLLDVKQKELSWPGLYAPYAQWLNGGR